MNETKFKKEKNAERKKLPKEKNTIFIFIYLFFFFCPVLFPFFLSSFVNLFSVVRLSFDLLLFVCCFNKSIVITPGRLRRSPGSETAQPLAARTVARLENRCMTLTNLNTSQYNRIHQHCLKTFPRMMKVPNY